ncbi:MAG: hypothetical protein L0Y71_19140 [Gemmataceae bacterium]|nr:hypothetical protein [Gemmataceae bacterium]
MGQTKEIDPRLAVNRFALALDAMLVNGVTMCLTPTRAAKDFIDMQLHAHANAELSNLLRSVDLAAEENSAFVDRLAVLKASLQALLAHGTMPKEQRERRIGQLQAAYASARQGVQQLEHRLGLTPSFYEASGDVHRDRVAGFAARVPELFEREQVGSVG